MNYDVDCTMQKIDETLQTSIKTWMNDAIKELGIDAYGSAFDLAVDAAYDLNLAIEENDYTIPQYVVEIAENIMGKEKKGGKRL